jgi:hypothetical protein
MTSKKPLGIISAFVALFAILASNACAIWSPMTSAVNLGGLNLDDSLGSTGAKAYQIGSAAAQPTGNNSSINSLLNSSNISAENSTAEALPLVAVDLSNYAKDRQNKSLAGYTNIMYPISESSGFTATTGSGGSGGGGCGCD